MSAIPSLGGLGGGHSNGTAVGLALYRPGENRLSLQEGEGGVILSAVIFVLVGGPLLCGLWGFRR